MLRLERPGAEIPVFAFVNHHRTRRRWFTERLRAPERVNLFSHSERRLTASRQLRKKDKHAASLLMDRRSIIS